MDNLWTVFSEAHAELMNATGWDVILSDLSSALQGGGRGLLQSLYMHVMAFVTAINWAEPFFTYLAIFHVIVIILVFLLTWRAPVGRILCVNLIVLLMGWSTSYLNEWGSANASKIFVDENINYFDSNGLFLSVVYWLPLFIIALVLLVRNFFGLLSLMVDYKRLQLTMEMRNKQQKQQQQQQEEQKNKKGQ